MITVEQALRSIRFTPQGITLEYQYEFYPREPLGWKAEVWDEVEGPIHLTLYLFQAGTGETLAALEREGDFPRPLHMEFEGGGVRITHLRVEGGFIHLREG